MSPQHTRISSAALVSRPTVQHPGSSHARWSPPQTAGPLSQPSSCMHRCHSTSELDRVHMTASTTTMAKVRTVRVDPTSYTSRHSLPLPTFSPSTHGKCTRPLQAHGSEAVWLHSIHRPNTNPLSAPDRTGATARLGFHRNISVPAAECGLRRHASRRRRRLEGGLRGRQVGRTGPMGSLVAARPAARPAASVRGGRHHHQC